MFRSNLLIILAMAFIFSPSCDARQFKKKPPFAVVMGTVYCDTCFLNRFSRIDHFISGATVAVECRDDESIPRFRKEVKTNHQGEFKVVLPPSITKHPERIEGCEVNLVASGDDQCAVASRASSSSMKLKSKNQETHIFSSGSLTFKPLKHPAFCAKLHAINDTHKDKAKPMEPLFFPIQDSNFPFLSPEDHGGFPFLPTFPQIPPLPELPPLPALPSLPSLPRLPRLPPAVGDQELDKMTYPRRGNPNPTHPGFFFPSPPATTVPLPINPLQPPSVVPRLPYQPPSPPFDQPPFNTPPSWLGGSIPTPSPPYEPTFPISLPPFPLLPPKLPGFPGFPPATAAAVSAAKKASPPTKG